MENFENSDGEEEKVERIEAGCKGCNIYSFQNMLYASSKIEKLRGDRRILFRDEKKKKFNDLIF